MEKIEYRLCENQLKAEDFIRLKVATGFRDRPIDQVEKALQGLHLKHISRNVIT